MKTPATITANRARLPQDVETWLERLNHAIRRARAIPGAINAFFWDNNERICAVAIAIALAIMALGILGILNGCATEATRVGYIETVGATEIYIGPVGSAWDYRLDAVRHSGETSDSPTSKTCPNARVRVTTHIKDVTP